MQENNNQNTVKMTILLLGKIDFKSKKVTKDKGHFILNKRLNQAKG